jgi:hypothetical protein
MKHTNINKASFSHSKINENETALNLDHRRVISALKKFNKLLNAKSVTETDHYMNDEEKSYRIAYPQYKNPFEQLKLHVSISNRTNDLSRILEEVDYGVEVCSHTLRHEHKILEPSHVDDLLWIGDQNDATILAQDLGVSRVIRRVRDTMKTLDYDTVFVSSGSRDDHTNLREKGISFYTWVMIIESDLDPCLDQTIRFDYVKHYIKPDSVKHHPYGHSIKIYRKVLFSRYFISGRELKDACREASFEVYGKRTKSGEIEGLIEDQDLKKEYVQNLKDSWKSDEVSND